VVGGVTPRCTKMAALFYEQFVEQLLPVSSTDCAEMVKLLENTFRSVNIALANEMALTCHSLGIDVWEVIEAAKSNHSVSCRSIPAPDWADTAYRWIPTI
jgi:UDP-N-acetyl-D-glucosamine dehydrogenase